MTTDDTSLPGRFNSGDRFEIAGDTMTRTDGRWSCSCGQTHDDEQVQVDLADGLGVLVMAADDAANVPAVSGAREARLATWVSLLHGLTCPSDGESCAWAEEGISETCAEVYATGLESGLMQLADAEVAAAVSEAQAEVARLRTDKATFEQWRDSWIIDMDTRLAQLAREEDRADTAEAEVERLREGIRALADEQWLDPVNYQAPLSSVLATLQKRVRALLSPSPAATTGEACCMAGTPLAGPGVTHEVGCTRPAPVSSGPTLGEVDPRLVEALRPLVARYGALGVKHTVDLLTERPVSSGEAATGEAGCRICHHAPEHHTLSGCDRCRCREYRPAPVVTPSAEDGAP